MSAHEKLQFADLEPVGPDTPVGRYLRLFWQPIYVGRDLPAGRAKPVEILGEMFTIYRSEGGEPHVVDFRCPHRATPLSLGWVEGDTIRCRYHGWRFASSGQCVEQPNEDKPFCDKIRARSYPVREYVGLIFAYLGGGEPPPFRRYPDFDRPGVIVTDPPEILPCTFWNKLDNDVSHVPWVHRATALRLNRPEHLLLRKETTQETEFGFISSRAERGEPANFKKNHYFFMPNARLFWTPTRAKGFKGRNIGDTKMTWMVPINDSKFVSFDVTHTPLEGDEAKAYRESRLGEQEKEVDTRWEIAEKVLAGEMTLEDIPAEIDAYTSFAIEDYVTQVGVGPIAGRIKERLGMTDVKVTLLRRLWLREVGKMLENKPLADWQIPAEPFVDLTAVGSP